MNTKTNCAMNASHTPGPYSVSGITGDCNIMARHRIYGIKITVAIVPGWPDITPEEHDANIALFQNAPTLLAQRNELRAALQAIVDDYEQIMGDGLTATNAPACLQQARAALNQKGDA